MKRIYVAEDDPGIQEALMMILQRAGFEVTIYPDGEPLMNEVANPPDLFILDRQLSGVDGLDVCKALKKNANTGHVPVIMLSASPQVGELSRAAGADTFLEKPFRMKQLLDLVRSELHIVPES